MDRLNPWIIGAALAITFAVVYVLCAAAFAAAPGATLEFFNAWFHGLNLAELQAGAKPFTVGVFVYGLVGVTGFGFVCGVLFAASYNLLRR
jgi:hypothetical protein